MIYFFLLKLQKSFSEECERFSLFCCLINMNDTGGILDCCHFKSCLDPIYFSFSDVCFHLRPKHTSVCIQPFKAYKAAKITLFNTPTLYDRRLYL